jgi:hypothetical protein
MKDGVKITVYRWAGKKWFLRIEGECIECDLTVSQVRSLIARNPSLPIEMEIKPWLSYLWESLRRGGWHPPVVLVDGKLVRQGTVPTLAELQAAVRRCFEASRIMVKENCSAFLQDRKPAEERGDCPAAILNRKALPR